MSGLQTSVSAVEPEAVLRYSFRPSQPQPKVGPAHQGHIPSPGRSLPRDLARTIPICTVGNSPSLWTQFWTPKWILVPVLPY